MKQRTKQLYAYILTLILCMSYLVNIPIQKVYADDNILQVTDSASLVTALNSAKAISDNNDTIIIDLCGNTVTLTEEFTFTEGNHIHIKNGSLVLNAPLKATNGAVITLCSLTITTKCNNALQSIGKSTLGQNSLLALTTSNQDMTIVGNSPSHAMIKLEDGGRCIVASDTYKVNINNNIETSLYDTVFDINSGQLVANSGLIVSSLKNGIDVQNSLNSTTACVNLMNDTTIYGKDNAIKVVGNSEEQPTIVNIFGGNYGAKTTILDISDNANVNINSHASIFSEENTPIYLKGTTLSTTIKNNGGQITTNGSVFYENVVFELNSDTNCSIYGLGLINNIKVLGTNNTLRLSGKDVTYKTLTNSGTNNTIIISNGIFENLPQNMELNNCKAVIKIDGYYYLGDSLTEYLSNKSWKLGDSMTVISNNYTFPEIEDLSWYDSNNKVCTKHDSTTPQTYYLLDKPCEHINTELRDVREATCKDYGYTGDIYCTKCNSLVQKGHNTPKTEHTIEHIEAKDATCTEDGNVEYYKCTVCNSMYREADLEEKVIAKDVIIPATGHNVVKTNGSEATCIEDGMIDVYTCQNCHNRYKDVDCTQLITDDNEIIIPKKAHNYIHHLAKEPTCDSEGNISYYECFDCGRKIADLDHSDTEIEDVTIDALDHSCTLISAKEPTCTENGNIECYQCQNCKKYFTDINGTTEIPEEEVLISALGHQNSDIIQENIINATCTENGSYNEVIRCTRCQEIISSTPKVIVSEGHNWSDWTVITPATETSVGSETRTCSKCNTIETREIPQLGHTHTLQYNSAISPTCTENGNIAYYECSSCHKKYTDTNATTELNDEDIIIRTTGHNLVKHDAVEAKWEDGNIEYYSCNNCDKLFDKNNNEISISDTIIKCPTFTNITITDTNGYKVALDNTSNFTVEFSKNGILKYQLQGSSLIFTPIKNGTTKILVKIGNITKQALNCTVDIHQCQHNNAIYHEGFDVTCTKKGLKSYYECPDCNTYYLNSNFDEECDFDDLVINPKGHVEEEITETKAPTCTEEGSYTVSVICSVCGEVLQEPATSIIQELGHNLQHIEAKEATCKAKGNIEYWKCKRCNVFFKDANGIYSINEKDTVIPIIQHNDTTMNHINATKPTISAEGIKEHYYCQYCKCYFNTDFTKTTLDKLKIAKLIDIKNSKVTNLKTAYAWTGSAIKPSITVTYNNKTLKLNTDYTITYSNNIYASTSTKKGTITIKGKGLYGGTLTKTFLIKKPILKYRSYIYNSGWEKSWITTKIGTTTSGATYCGTKNVLLEGFQMKLSGIDGYVTYRAYVQKQGWDKSWQKTTNAGRAGTKTNKRVERVQLKTSGQVNTLYDIYYRVYVKGKGWTGWGKNGQVVGTTLSKPITNIQVQLVPKGKKFSVTAKDLMFK